MRAHPPDMPARLASAEIGSVLSLCSMSVEEILFPLPPEINPRTRVSPLSLPLPGLREQGAD